MTPRKPTQTMIYLLLFTNSIAIFLLRLALREWRESERKLHSLQQHEKH